MIQLEIDARNRFLLGEFLKRLNKGEFVAGIVTIKEDGTGIGWYPAVESQSGAILDMLRKKPDEVTIDRLV